MAAKGYVPLRRGLLEHLAVMTGVEVKIYTALLILADFRTGKVKISIENLGDVVGFSRRHVQTAIKRLEPKYIRVKRSTNRWHDTEFTIVKYFKLPKNQSSDIASEVTSDIASEVTSDIASYITSGVQSSDQHKGAPKNSEEVLRSIKKKIFTSQDKKLATKLFELIKNNDPKAKNPNLSNWACDINKINRIDNRDYNEIENVLIWCQKDTFWSTNILSASKLRKQFPQLALKMSGGHVETNTDRALAIVAECEAEENNA